MGTAPFQTFSGYLKQHSHETLSVLEQELFDFLFPAFQGTTDAEDAYKKAQASFRASGLVDMFKLMQAERRPRRFSGFSMGRRRYFTVCTNASGNDSQTLAHELRAYRDTVDLGMIEVVDLAAGCQLSIGATTAHFNPQLAVAVLIHEPERLPQKFRRLPFQKVPGLKQSPIFIVRFPYRVMHCTIEQTIDLRYPEVQDWFFSMFRHPCDVCDAEVAPDISPDTTPTTAHSRFHFENGRAPAPDSFWSMLPTLMNPILGGGNPGDTGSTLVMIGHWMRQHKVNALVFPSARCDATAVFQEGALVSWQGWNLIDYRNSPLPEQFGTQAVTFVVSPWAWVSLPHGVRMHVAEESSEYAGSFAIDGMVNYWARDYLNQLKALEIARSKHGWERQRDKAPDSPVGFAFRAFEIGVLSIRWARMAAQRSSAEETENVILELQGLALPHDMYALTGRALELWSDLQQGAATLNDVLLASLTVNDLVCRSMKRQHPQNDLDKLCKVGADLELILFFLTVRAMAGAAFNVPALDSDAFLRESQTALTAFWLDGDMRTRTERYYEMAFQQMRCGVAETERAIEDGVQLQQFIYQQLRAKHSNQ